MAASGIDRPPPDITPDAFFETWLPAELARIRAAAPDTPVPSARLQVALTGDGGGTWTLSVEDGVLSAAAGADAGADLAIAIPVQDWRAVISAEGEDDLLAPDASAADALVGAGAIHQVLRDLKGTLRFEVPGFRGRDWGLDVTIGGQAEPRATIGVDAATLAQMRNKSLPPAQAYFGGKIRIGGDTNFAMQIGMALMSRMA